MLGKLCISAQISGYFRFDHPVRPDDDWYLIFRAKGWAEGVDLVQGACVTFDVELAGYGKKCFGAEKIIGVGWLLGPIDLINVETRNNSPAPSQSLAVMIGVLTRKTILVEVIVYGVSNTMTIRAIAPKVLVRGRKWATPRKIRTCAVFC